MVKKFKFTSDGAERILNLEETKDLDYSDSFMVVEDHYIYSYDDLLKLASSDEFKNKEILEGYFVRIIFGG